MSYAIRLRASQPDASRGLLDDVKGESRLIGSCGLHLELFTRSDDPPHDFRPILPRPHLTEIGYYLFKEYRGFGIIPKVIEALCSVAFDEIGLLRVQALVFSFNAASARALTKSGFSFEGCLRSFHVKDGVPLDAHSFSMLKGEWEEWKKTETETSGSDNA